MDNIREMSTIQDLLDTAIDFNLLYANGSCGGASCTSGCCPVDCLRYSSLVARIGVFTTTHENPSYDSYSNVVETSNCFGEPVLYSTISARHGIFSTIILTKKYRINSKFNLNNQFT